MNTTLRDWTWGAFFATTVVGTGVTSAATAIGDELHAAMESNDPTKRNVLVTGFELQCWQVGNPETITTVRCPELSPRVQCIRGMLHFVPIEVLA